MELDCDEIKIEIKLEVDDHEENAEPFFDPDPFQIDVKIEDPEFQQDEVSSSIQQITSIPNNTEILPEISENRHSSKLVILDPFKSQAGNTMSPNTNLPSYPPLIYPTMYQSSQLNSSNKKSSSSFGAKLKDKDKKEVFSRKCNVCPKTFKTVSGFNHHDCSEKSIESFGCGRCGKTFTTKQAFKKHQNIHDKKFECKVCGKLFPYSYHLKLHENNHKGIRPFKCQVCGKSFTRKYCLENHSYTHKNERPYCCDKCGKSFKRISDLRGHQLVNGKSEPFKCQECGKSYASCKTSFKWTHLASCTADNNIEQIVRPWMPIRLVQAQETTKKSNLT